MKHLLALLPLLLGLACTSANAFPAEVPLEITMVAPEPTPTPAPIPTYIYLANWEWFAEKDPFSYWRCPGGDCVESLDVRPLPAQGQAGGAPEGYGFFAYETLPDICTMGCPHYGIYLGNGWDTALNPLIVTQVETLLLLPPNDLQGGSIRSIVWDLFSMHGDPTGQTRWKPLQGSPAHGFKIDTGRNVLVDRSWEEVEEIRRWGSLEVDHQDWLSLKAANELVGSEHYKRVLTMLAEKYFGRSADIQEVANKLLQAWGEEFVEALPHRTTIGDTFVDTNGTSLDAHTATGDGGGWTWTETRSTSLQIQSNAAVNTTTDFVEARADSALSTADHYSEAVITEDAANTDLGVCVRMATGATPEHYLWHSDGTGDQWQFYKYHSAAFTQVGANENTGYSTPSADTYRLEINGSSLEGFENGTTRHTATDSSITGNLYGGIRSVREGTFDDFVASDSAAAARRIIIIWES